MRNFKFLGIIFIFLACKQIEADQKSTNLNEEKNQNCAIESETAAIIMEILKESRVKAIVKSASSFGINNIKLESDMPNLITNFKVDSLSISLSDSIKTPKDLILKLKKVSCDSGKFHFSAVPKSYSIDGNFLKTSEDTWKVESTSYVEIN